MRPSGREANQLRPIEFKRKFTKHAEGSVLTVFGDTQVICTASVIEGVPRFLKGQNQGWLTAEYSMLPRATHTRSNREHHKPSGRTQEIQRLIGRSLRQALDLGKLGDYTIQIDCDVIQADGGTRTASISGGAVALADAIRYMMEKKLISQSPIKHLISSVSVGVFQGTPVLDLDYAEDSKAETDMNVVMNDAMGFIELQGTAEDGAFSNQHLTEMLELAKSGINEIQSKQKDALGL